MYKEKTNPPHCAGTVLILGIRENNCELYDRMNAKAFMFSTPSVPNYKTFQQSWKVKVFMFDQIYIIE